MRVAGLLLAAGEGRRMGVPKSVLADDHGVPFLDRAIGALFDGGCDLVVVVLGAAAEEAADILRIHGWTEVEELSVVVASDWADGMGVSLKAGLTALPEADAALVTLVDLPDVTDRVVARMAEQAGRDALARATYAGRPGHPVVLGHRHWRAVAETLHGDRGARAYLDAHGVREVPCDDLADGRDLDTPEDLARRLNA